MSDSLLLSNYETEGLATPPRVDARSAPLAPSAGTRGGEIRPLESRDIPAVAALFHRSFRRGSGAAPQSLQRYFHELFLHHPCAEAEMPSRVHMAADGAVNGFIGVLPARMLLNGRPIRAAIAGSLMVEDPQRDPLAGARLMRAFLKGPQELSFSESANPVSQGMWERLRGVSVPASSMEWVRAFQPLATAVCALRPSFPLRSLISPLARGIDRLTSPFTHRLLAIEGQPGMAGHDADEDELIACVSKALEDFTLRPNWDSETLRWILSHAREKGQHGQLHRRVVNGRGGQALGCYLYFGDAGKIAWVLQILARPEYTGAVIDDLLADAARRGCVAVRGRSQERLLDALLRRNCVMVHRASTVVHSRDPEILQAIRNGDAMLNGLAGESWSRLIGGQFD